MNRSFRKEILKGHYCIYSFLNRIIPKKRNYIFIYDSQFMRQNCWAFYKYLVNHGYANHYKIWYYSEKYKNDYGADLFSGVVKNPIAGWFLHLVSKYTFYEYHNFKYCCKPGNNQITVYLTHGMPFKNYGYLVETPDHPYEDDYSFLLMTSGYYIPIMKTILGCKDNQVYIGGMPRCDQLFDIQSDTSWAISGKRNILWMPTFRQSKENSIDDSVAEFPLLNEGNITIVDDFLRKNELHLIIKLHPFQNNITWLSERKYQNISVLLNEDLEKHKTELYELIGSVDMLLTDYSSVYSDYLLTGKPLAFVVDDIDDYQNKRGFVDQQLLEMLPGPIIKDYDGFIKCLADIDRIDTEYKDKRENAQQLLSPMPVGQSFSSDLCSFLHI